MATAATTGKILCVTCGKGKVAYKCEGCSQTFCINHLNQHLQLLSKQLDEIEDRRNIFQQALVERKSDPPQSKTLIEQINQWEKDSIDKIQQTAHQARQKVIKHTEKYYHRFGVELDQLTEKLRQIRQEGDFNETHLNQFKHQLKELEEQLNQTSNISVRQENSSSFINKIAVSVACTQLYIPDINVNTNWTLNRITIAGGNGKGNQLNQLRDPCGIFIDDDQTIYLADYSNHRIVEWKKDATSGQVVAGGNNQLNHPVNVILDKQNDFLIICDYKNRRVVRWPCQYGTNGETIISNINCWDLAMDNDGYLYVSDIDKHEVRRWKMGEQDGTLVAGGKGSGNRLNQLSYPYYIFVDPDQSVYVSDYGNHRVMKWLKGARGGVVVAGGHGQGSGLNQLFNPRGIVVDQLGTVYVADQNNHRVMRWLKGATEGSLIAGGNGQGAEANQLNNPVDLSFDLRNNLYVVDYSNHQTQKFIIV